MTPARFGELPPWLDPAMARQLALVPVAHMAAGMSNYYLHGILPGSFARHLLANELVQAIGCADPQNLANLQRWAQWLIGFDLRAWGSPARLEQWAAGGGLWGRDPAAVHLRHEPGG